MSQPTRARDKKDSPDRRVTDLVTALDKVVRALNLYEGRGEVVRRSVRELHRMATELTGSGPLTLHLTPGGLSLKGQRVDPSDRPLAYMFRLYGEGVRELTLLRGVTEEELQSFCEVLRTDPKSLDGALASLLWERDLDFIRHYAVDTLALEEDEAEAGDELLSGQVASRLPQGRAKDGDQLALSAQDARSLRTQEQRPWARQANAPNRPPARLKPEAKSLKLRFGAVPPVAPFLALARDSRGSREQASPLVVDLYDTMLRTEDIAGVAGVLQGLGGYPAERSVLLAPERALRLAPLYLRHHGQLIDALRVLLAVSGELPGLLDLLAALPPGAAADALKRALDEGGLDLTPAWASQLESEDEAAVLEAIAALGKLGTDPALEALSRCLSSRLTRIRRAALDAMEGRYHSSARRALGRALRDPDKDNRMLALGILSASGDDGVAGALVSAVESSRFPELDEDEQSAIYAALGKLASPRTLRHFKVLLNRSSWFAGLAQRRQQVMAAHALGDMGIAPASELLEGLSGRWIHRAQVRNALKRGLQVSRGGQP